MMAIIHVVPWSMCVIFFVLVISCENQISDLFNYRKLTSTLSDVFTACRERKGTWEILEKLDHK